MEIKEYKILLVDDEPDILEHLGYNLAKEGFQIYKSSNGKDAINLASEIKPHLIILDVMMPEMDGIETCREMRKIPTLKKTITVFLTARGEDYSQIAGFNAGADDYIVKPIKPRVFVSRINALLRRFDVEEETVDKVYIAGMFINRERYTVVKNNHEITLPKKEFDLLWLLISKANKVVTRNEIFLNIWGNSLTNGRSIDVHVRMIRKKLEIDCITTIKGVGYKFEINKVK